MLQIEFITGSALIAQHVNPSETEYLIIGTSQQRAKITDGSLYFKDLILQPSMSARNLGVEFDCNLDFKSHISSISRSAFFCIRLLRQIRTSLNKGSAILLANTLVKSKIDYCYSLLYGLPHSTLLPLQRCQNALARVGCRSSRLQSHSSDLLEELHWLPIPKRINYKIAYLTFKTQLTGKPSYLFELLTPNQKTRSLRSSDKNLLKIPDIRSEIGRRSFSFAAPTIWKSLPEDMLKISTISLFRRELRTHLFKTIIL